MKEKDVAVIGEMLKSSRKSKGDLANAWGTVASAATAFFKGKKDLTVTQLDKTAELLGISTTELFSRMRGETAESSNDDIFHLALKRAKEAVDYKQAKLSKSEFAEFVYILFKLGLSEKRTTGQPILSLATAELLLEKKIALAN